MSIPGTVSGSRSSPATGTGTGMNQLLSLASSSQVNSLQDLCSASNGSAYTVINNPVSLNNPSLGRLLEYLGGNAPSSSNSVKAKLSKVLKTKKKEIQSEAELIKELNSWINVLPNKESAKLIFEYARSLEVMVKLQEEMLQKYENISLQLGYVDKRERKANALKAQRKKELRSLRQKESRTTENQTIIFYRESIECLNTSIEVVQEQYVRTINNALKGSFIDFHIFLRNMSTEIKNSSIGFFKFLNDGSSRNYQRYITANDMKPALRMASTSSSIVQGEKTVSPNPSPLHHNLEIKRNSNNNPTLLTLQNNSVENILKDPLVERPQARAVSSIYHNLVPDLRKLSHNREKRKVPESKDSVSNDNHWL
ncbi:Hypothetical protein PP7435_CHR2-2342 [Komagataella phaffii CBS 7435]|uniref:Uncharacterized protein n=2 Tax=Komagataella phaffii TaxID=460519 RepID=C4R0R5_KOMPG|nr:uncharacterized protein PAS_chr2-1_0848 [Komagataella phaffii GS115]AOA62203.1 GQ67_00505T0 [Komagataella phaffii]CAH2448391.1 Hypothetical protein BQ9382_C2-4495 [Komagataella phaffii CBS 7435]AOA68138.1 GQ68_00883T0 [Komagataella phaffii GS115]CAY69089.1 hypothetical protein PAS_chr2-1_0848 [Komagataella phaffii GS115]SCV12071.1 Hypothetical protein PP7435_CHR2-2342 [Komagataella phaffii CBS 7435]